MLAINCRYSNFFRWFFAFLLISPFLMFKGAAQNKPNIIIILADDMGYGDLSCYGQQNFVTPNIDKLANDGIRFTNFYSGATVCAPSRAALLTGLHNGHNSVRGNQPFPQMLGNEPTIASILKQNGYQTGLIGKWGIGHPQPVGDPQRCGFQYSFGYLNMWHAHNFFPEFLYENDKKYPLPGNKLLPVDEWSNNSWVGTPENAPEGYGEAKIKGQYVPDEMEKKALEFITLNKKNPFFLFFTPTIPHANNEIKLNGMEVPSHGMYAGKDWPEVEKGFAAAINRLDETIKSIRNHLEREGLDKNTLIIFTSDNGPHNEGGHNAAFFNSSGIYRGTKRDLYEGGIRIPMIAWWPGVIAPGSINKEPFSQIDFLATACEIAGVRISNKTDGVSLLPSLKNQNELQGKHKYLYWEFYESGGRQALLQYPWKLVKLNTTTYAQNGKTELYNLEQDPREKNDLFSKNPEKVKNLEKLLKEAHVPHPQMSLFVPKPGQAGKI
jgi:arylsulfatase A-like enzyme